jgi:PIN domain nuclease of toxin-antitoxin system
LSLGDRACLALAKVTGATAVTADRGWAIDGLDVDVLVIR